LRDKTLRKSWDVDVFDRSANLIEHEDVAPDGAVELQIPDALSGFSVGGSNIQSNFPNPRWCRDPIQGSISSFDQSEKKGSLLRAVAKFRFTDGLEIGGIMPVFGVGAECEIDRIPIRKMTVVAASGGTILPLPDNTLLLFDGSDIVRLDRYLRSPYDPSSILIIYNEQWEADILNTDDVFAIEKKLLEMLTGKEKGEVSK
jgi:hypothetical protein